MQPEHVNSPNAILKHLNIWYFKFLFVVCLQTITTQKSQLRHFIKKLCLNLDNFKFNVDHCLLIPTVPSLALIYMYVVCCEYTSQEFKFGNALTL